MAQNKSTEKKRLEWNIEKALDIHFQKIIDDWRVCACACAAAIVLVEMLLRQTATIRNTENKTCSMLIYFAECDSREDVNTLMSVWRLCRGAASPRDLYNKYFIEHSSYWTMNWRSNSRPIALQMPQTRQTSIKWNAHCLPDPFRKNFVELSDRNGNETTNWWRLSQQTRRVAGEGTQQMANLVDRPQPRDARTIEKRTSTSTTYTVTQRDTESDHRK